MTKQTFQEGDNLVENVQLQREEKEVENILIKKNNGYYRNDNKKKLIKRSTDGYPNVWLRYF